MRGETLKNSFFWTVHFHNWRKNRPTKCRNYFFIN